MNPKGVARATVSNNIDPKGMCRVQVTIPGSPVLRSWAPLSVPMAGDKCGMVMIPDIGAEVLVAFEGEDLNHPYVLGGLWGTQGRPPIDSDYDTNKRKLVSRKQHYLLFDDGDKGVVELAHEKARKIVLDDNGFEIHDENGNVVKVDSISGAMTIEAKGTLSIKAASITIESTGTLELKAGATMTIRGALVNIN